MMGGRPTSLVRGALCLGIVALAAAGCGRSATTATPSPLLTPPTSAPVERGTAPSGWVPVAFDRAQISVPSDWATATTDCPYGSAPGMVIVRTVTYLSGCVLETGPPISNVVSVTPESPPLLQPDGRYTSIHGITVSWGLPGDGSIGYQVPSLGVQIDARGSLGRQVLATLTRSPLP